MKAPDGSLLLRLERQRTEVVLRIPNILVDPAVEKELTRMVAEVLSQRKALMAQRTGSRSVDDCRPVADAPLATFQPVSR